MLIVESRWWSCGCSLYVLTTSCLKIFIKNRGEKYLRLEGEGLSAGTYFILVFNGVISICVITVE